MLRLYLLGNPNLFPDLKELIERILEREFLELCKPRELRHAAGVSFSDASTVSGSSVGQ